MTWSVNEAILVELSTSETRKLWAEEKAYEIFHEIEAQLKQEHREKTRIGALGFQNITGTEGLHAWMFPIEGHPKILGLKNTVELLSVRGEVLYQGAWGEVPLSLVETHQEFFIWLPYRHGGAPQKLDWKTRVLGAFRFLKNRHRKSK